MLTDDQLNFYRENGYVLVKGLFNKDEMARHRQALHDLAHRLYVETNRGSDATWGAARDYVEGGKTSALQHCHDVQFYNADLARLIVDERLAEVAAQIIGPNVQLHHTKMFIKPPEKGSPFPMHQDAPFFPHANHSMIAAIVHFDDASLEKGCVRVVPGSYHLGLLPHDSTGGWHLDPAQYPVEDATPCPAEAGDVLFFSYLTIHGSGVNVSNEARTTLLIQLRDPLDPPMIRTHESRGQGMMLAGVDPSCCTTKPLSDDHHDNPVHKVNGRGADCGEVTMGGEVKMGDGMGMAPPTMGG